MAKYNVGVGDAFPVDADNRNDDREAERAPERAPDRESDRIERAEGRACRPSRYRGGARYFFFRLAAMLGLIYVALHLVNGHGPRGLLIAAGIMVALGVFRLIFWRSDDEWFRARREKERRWREERRRYWGDR